MNLRAKFETLVRVDEVQGIVQRGDEVDPRIVAGVKANVEKVTRRPSTAFTVTVTSIVMPSKVDPLCERLMPVPTLSSPVSQYCSSRSRHATSTSRTIIGVA